ncbi:hypothetical protein AZ270_gp27 [Acidianus tailed spindle virus]|uniref:hypothetical protein n=1 Tax=Acidianus tailed spindle virus TaxID=1797140 RepID=UPI00076F2E65|nr:hypothetical protein AZ270_gp27 [Acidianus tailed spindle virus]AME30050.1 hypothetical protein ATSV_F285 [Acidianus tailed spindle virus]
MAQEFWDENKQQIREKNAFLAKNDLYTSVIRYNVLPDEILFLRLEYDGGDITFTINKNGYKVSVDDYELGSFVLVNRNIDNSNFSQQIMKILSKFGNSVDLTYTKASSEAKINGEEITVDNNKMINLIDKLFDTILSYVKNNFSSCHFTLDFDKVIIYYQYEFRNPKLNGYWAYTPEYIYNVSYTYGDTLTIYKKQGNDEPKEAFRIEIGIDKYSRRILSKVINLVLQSKIKTNDYEIEIEGENVTINGKHVKVEDKVVKDITDSIKNQVEYVINTVKNKLDMLG